MQDLLKNIPAPIAIILIVAGVLALVVVVILTRRLRRRQPSADNSMGVSPGLSGQVDYTSLPLDDEPSDWRDRFANLSLASKILVILVPVLAILGILVLVLTLLSGGSQPTVNTPLATTEPVSLTVTKADIVRVNPEITLSITAETTGLSDGTEVTVELLANGQPVPFLRPEDTKGAIRRGRVEIQARKLAEAKPAQQETTYTIRVSTTDGQATGEKALTVLKQFEAAFFDKASPVVPTPTAPAPTTPPTQTPVAPDVTPSPSATPAPELPTGTEATIGNGGNVRALPALTANNRVGGVDAGNKVQLIEQTPNGQWYRIRFTNTDDGKEQVGWVSASLLALSAEVKAQIPVATIVSVFKNGPIYERPDSASTELDRVNVDEVVNLKQKTAAGDWYEVDNVRGISGWVQASLLGIPKDVAAKVPVAP
jgi:flagellar FliL protein